MARGGGGFSTVPGVCRTSAPRASSEHGVSVRMGHFVVHCQLWQLSEVISILESRHPAVPLEAEELRKFPEELRELVASTVGGEPATAGAALQAAAPWLSKPTANAARGLLRARGAAQHCIPAGKPSRLLQDIRAALGGKSRCRGSP